MSTNSTISILLPEGNVRSIYCHWDGYLDGVGVTLKNSYQDKDKINRLINHGNISSLEPEISAPSEVKHSFNNPIWGVTVFFCRDKHEDLEFKEYENLEAFGFACPREFNYLFDTNKNVWLVSEWSMTDFVEF